MIRSGGGPVLFRAAQQSRNEPIEALDLLGNLGNEVSGLKFQTMNIAVQKCPAQVNVIIHLCACAQGNTKI